MSQKNARETLPGDNEYFGAMAQEGDEYWLKTIRTSFQSSTDYIDSGIRDQWEKALARFQSRHPEGSKYLTPAYRNRSKIFRPKTRSYSRRAEALAAKALFTSADLIDVRGQNKGSAEQAASARINKELLQYRLEHSIPWFLTAMGARQDCFNQGICVSLSTWIYEQQLETSYKEAFDEFGEPIIDEETGLPMGEEITSVRVTKDEPTIDLIPVENLRFDPNADWRNPIKDSPVITVMLSMYAGEVLQRMKRPNPVTGRPEWREYGLATICAAGSSSSTDNNESTRQARQGTNRTDPMDVSEAHENQSVWVHLNIVRVDGTDYAFYSLGTMLLLTDPAPVNEVLPLGRDSLTVGISIVEAHRPYPIGGNELISPLQSETNDIGNQRMDNVKLALNKRYVVRRGANIDQAALSRSTPGGGIMAENPEQDVRVLEYKDVTGSSYQEQDRLAQETDELVGAFSGSSVQANRSLNETVGGMNMLKNDAMDVAEYELRTWIETWVEPVLRKLQKLEAMFETDETVLALAGENSELFQQYGRDIAIDELLDRELVVSVNVAMGHTDPIQKMQRFQGAVQGVSSIPEFAAKLNPDEIGKEIFSLSGFSDGERFMYTDEQLAERQQKMAGQEQSDNSIEAAKIRAQAQLEEARIQSEDRRYEADRRFEAAAAKIANDSNLKLKDLYEKIGVEKAKLQTERDKTALVEGNRSREMNLRRDTGAGI